MTTLNNLREAINQLLEISALSSLLHLNSNTEERAYEAYIFSLCRQAVINQGGTATLKGINSGDEPTVLVFRGGPGSMSSTSQDFCYANCSLRGKRFEIHVDIEYVGQSNVTHEIDVSIYEHERAELVRNESLSPRTNKPLIGAIECKFYSRSQPGVALARTFVGLITDCSGNKFKAFACNRESPRIEAFLSAKSSAPEPFVELTPLNIGCEERFIRFLEQILRKWAAAR